MNATTRSDSALKGLMQYWGFIIGTVVGLATAVASTQVKDLPTTGVGSLVLFLFSPNSHLIITVSVGIVLPFVLNIVFLGARALERKRPLWQYLHMVENKNSQLKPTGFAQSEALLSVSVPLSENFIRLYATPDRPRYEISGGQAALIEQIRRNAHLSPDECEAQIQLLKRQWWNLLGEGQTGQNTEIADVLQQLSAAQPIAVILGIPGSGKSTTMRWLALHMAQASCFSLLHRGVNRLLEVLPAKVGELSLLSRIAALPKGLGPAQVPIFVRIGDYAKRLKAKEDNHESLSFQEFLMEYLPKEYQNLPTLPGKLFAEMAKQHCLFLFDGLDEVASDSLRRQVLVNIMTFIESYLPERSSQNHYNRFLITSRIVGYEASPLTGYAHYTLRDLEDEQIKDFLTHWCPAVERYQTSRQHKLIALQEQEALRAGYEERERLLTAFANSPGIKRLAVNPLMLTILALLQKSGKTLPHRRIELYDMVTRTLLANRNYETGRRYFSDSDLPLVDQVLSELAYALHKSDFFLTKLEVNTIACKVMTEVTKAVPDQNTVENFTETIRDSSGLFVEIGQGLYSFMHRTFQEYYVARYLLRQTPKDRKDFVRTKFTSAIWREALLLAIASKSTENKAEANELIETIATMREPCDAFLHRSPLFAASSVVDCTTWSIERSLQRRIANTLFDIYGDPYGKGRYTSLQQEIEKIALLWLRGQEESSQQHIWPPLLEAWRTALCDSTNACRQEGAVHLLASLAPDLPDCPAFVLYALIPPLWLCVSSMRLALLGGCIRNGSDGVRNSLLCWNVLPSMRWSLTIYSHLLLFQQNRVILTGIGNLP